MLDTLPQISSLEIKGENNNIFHINLDNSENSTREDHPDCENSKCIEDASDFVKTEDLFLEPKASKKKFGENFFLQKKREKAKKNCNSKNKSGKYKIIYNLFSEFKSSDKTLYKEFGQFHFIEKNIKNNLYSSPAELASEIRTVFSSIFANLTEYSIYNKTFIFCENFEKIYKKYDNNILTKKCKNLSDIINRLKRELRQTELNQTEKNNNFVFSYSSLNNLSSKKNKTKSIINDSDNDLRSEMPIRKLKNELTNKIKKLNNNQKKGIIRVISDSEMYYESQESPSKEMQIDINKMSFDKLKSLEKYLNDCINDNNSSMCNLLEKKWESQNNKFIEEEKEYEILKNDDLSSCLSDDDEDEEE
jgi:hypothetical protein